MTPQPDLRKLKRVLEGTSYLMLAEAAKPLMSFLLILVISRQLGREGMGAYSIILSVTAMFELIATAGLPQLIVRGIAADPESLCYYASGGVGVALLASSVVLPVMLLAVRALNYPADIAAGIRLLTCTIVLTTAQQYAIAICEGLQNMRLRAIVSTLDTLGRLVVGVCMILRGNGVLGVIQGMVIVRLCATVIAIALMAKYATISFDRRMMLRHSYKLLLAGLPFLLIVVTNTAFWSTNTIMLSKLSTVENVGVYNAAYRVMDILKNILASYLIALLPMMSASFARSPAELKQDCDVSLKYLTLTTVPIATGISMLAPRIILLIYGAKFAAATPVLQILIWTVCAFCLALVFARVLIASHHQLFDLYCNCAALVFNVAVGWPLIHRYGSLGAGIATLLSLVFFGAIQYTVVVRRLFRPVVFEPVAKAVLASLAMALVIYLIPSWPMGLTIPVGAAVYLCALIGLGTFSKHEVTAFSQLAADMSESFRRPRGETS